ncbi:hypothetical protein ACNSVY_004214 [Klebsiella quasipneumoniae]
MEGTAPCPPAPPVFMDAETSRALNCSSTSATGIEAFFTRFISTTNKRLPQQMCVSPVGVTFSIAALGISNAPELIISPEKHLKFLGGDLGVFDKDKTEESRNKLYVAITRARYSLAFVVEEKHLTDIKLPHWVRPL